MSSQGIEDPVNAFNHGTIPETATHLFVFFKVLACEHPFRDGVVVSYPQLQSRVKYGCTKGIGLAI
jgi:hypothetical protein